MLRMDFNRFFVRLVAPSSGSEVVASTTASGTAAGAGAGSGAGIGTATAAASRAAKGRRRRGLHRERAAQLAAVKTKKQQKQQKPQQQQQSWTPSLQYTSMGVAPTEDAVFTPPGGERKGQGHAANMALFSP